MKPSEEKMLNEIAAREQWLASCETPGPSPAAVARVKEAMRRELQTGATSAKRPWRPWHGALASAAAIALCATVVWQSGQAPSTIEVASVDEDHAWVAPSNAKTTVIATFESDLDQLETSSDEDSWALSGASMYEAMEDALDESLEPSNG